MTKSKLNNNTIMKAQSITTIFLAVLLVAACGPQLSELEQKKADLTEAEAKMAEIKANITKLKKEIAQEDPEYFDDAKSAVQVTTYAAAKSAFEHKIEVRGTVMSRTNVQVGSEIPGRLTRVLVKEGQKVSRGQALATLDGEDMQTQIDAINTQLEFATTVFEKRERLWKKNIGTEIQYLEAKNNKESLEKQRATLETQMAKTTIRAPFGGTIESVPVKSGQVVQPGMPVALLVSSADMYLSAEVSEVYVGKFKKGDNVLVTIPTLDDSFETEITSIGQVINQASRTFTVEVKLPKPNTYKTNQVAILELVDYRSEDTVIIPSRTIQKDSKGNFVYLIDNNKAKKQHIELGLSYDNHTQVVAGLAGGESVVDKGNRSVGEGTAVKLEN